MARFVRRPEGRETTGKSKYGGASFLMTRKEIRATS